MHLQKQLIYFSASFSHEHRGTCSYRVRMMRKDQQPRPSLALGSPAHIEGPHLHLHRKEPHLDLPPSPPRAEEAAVDRGRGDGLFNSGISSSDSSSCCHAGCRLARPEVRVPASIPASVPSPVTALASRRTAFFAGGRFESLGPGPSWLPRCA